MTKNVIHFSPSTSALNESYGQICLFLAFFRLREERGMTKEFIAVHHVRYGNEKKSNQQRYIGFIYNNKQLPVVYLSCKFISSLIFSWMQFQFDLNI